VSDSLDKEYCKQTSQNSSSQQRFNISKLLLGKQIKFDKRQQH
jgi:hypothetical protein